MAFSEKRQKKYIKNCKICNKEFSAFFTHSKFCSLECKLKHGREFQKQYHRNKTKKQVEKVVDHEYNKFIKTKSDIKKRMTDKKGYIYCELCKRSDCSLEGHHIVYRSEAPRHENLHHPKNVIMLCIFCHRNIHKKKHENRKELIETRKLWELFPRIIFE